MAVPKGDPLATFRRVGNVLIVVGLADIALMIYVITSGHGYSSSFNIFAVIAGGFLRRGSAKAARIVTLFSGFFLSAVVGLSAALLVAYPWGLIRTYLQVTPSLDLAKFASLLIGFLAFLTWVYRSLAQPAVQAAIQSSLGRGYFWNRSWFGVAFGLLAFFGGGVLSITLTNNGQSAERAIGMARAKLDSEHRYFVSSYSRSRVGDEPAKVRVTVLAYSTTAIELVDLEWDE